LSSATRAIGTPSSTIPSGRNACIPAPAQVRRRLRSLRTASRG